jgi:uncharacterized protein YacL
MVPSWIARTKSWLVERLGGTTHSGKVVLWLLRGCFGALIIGLALMAFGYYNSASVNDPNSGMFAFVAILGIGFLVVATDLLVRNKQITTISAVYFGLLLGLLLGTLFSTAVEPFITDWAEKKPEVSQSIRVKDESGATKELVFVTRSEQKSERTTALRLLITVICCYISISTLLQTKDEFRFIIPYVEFSKQVKGGRPLVLDTSVIIDGRIADICETGIIDTKMIVPRFVLQELQSVADSSDKIKRNRGRRGLDMLKRMQTNPRVELQMHEANLAELREVHKVDERLVVFAKVVGARVVTNDFNLNKIAQLQGVEVVNLNEMANALKLVALPGEHLTIRVVKQGDQLGQGVGYLDDGTMVVVEQGRSAIGQEVIIAVTSVLQTPAGRMIFGRIEGRPNSASAPAPDEHVVRRSSGEVVK